MTLIYIWIMTYNDYIYTYLSVNIVYRYTIFVMMKVIRIITIQNLIISNTWNIKECLIIRNIKKE